MTDPYSTLGVSKNATDAEIKSAYRRLAKKYHPDAGGDQTRFADISNAYNYIKDADSRQNFENGQFDPSKFQQSQSPFGNAFGNFEDIFGQMFGQMPPRQRPTQQTAITYHVDIADVYDCAVKNLNISLPNGQSKPITIRIPKGIKSEEEVTYQGMAPGGGDLVVKFVIKNTNQYYVVEHNVHMPLTIKLKEAMIGAEKVIHTIDNKAIKLHIKSGTNHGTKLRIPEGGLPRRNKPNGDLIIDIKVNIPSLTEMDLDKSIRQVL